MDTETVVLRVGHPDTDMVTLTVELLQASVVREPKLVGVAAVDMEEDRVVEEVTEGEGLRVPRPVLVWG